MCGALARGMASAPGARARGNVASAKTLLGAGSRRQKPEARSLRSDSGTRTVVRSTEADAMEAAARSWARSRGRGGSWAWSASVMQQGRREKGRERERAGAELGWSCCRQLEALESSSRDEVGSPWSREPKPGLGRWSRELGMGDSREMCVVLSLLREIKGESGKSGGDGTIPRPSEVARRVGDGDGDGSPHNGIDLMVEISLDTRIEDQLRDGPSSRQRHSPYAMEDRLPERASHS